MFLEENGARRYEGRREVARMPDDDLQAWALEVCNVIRARAGLPPRRKLWKGDLSDWESCSIARTIGPGDHWSGPLVQAEWTVIAEFISRFDQQHYPELIREGGRGW